MTDHAGSLELRAGLSGPRYFLAGRLVPNGSVVQLCFSGGWVTGRMEWTGVPDGKPRFHASIELDGGGVVEHSLPLPEGALLRWPGE